MRTDRKLSAPDVSQRLGVPLRTWWSYVSRAQAPAPDGREEVSNRAWWFTSTVDAWSKAHTWRNR